MSNKRKALTRATRKLVYKKYGGHCAYCGKQIPYEEMQVDHVQPIYRGGTNDVDNLLPSCHPCNFYKDSMELEEFRKRLQGIPQLLMEQDFSYRMAVAHGLICRDRRKVKFYFEEFQ